MWNIGGNIISLDFIFDWYMWFWRAIPPTTGNKSDVISDNGVYIRVSMLMWC